MRVISVLVLVTGLAGLQRAVAAQANDRSRDRGAGVLTSMFATYVERGQVLVFPFFAYSRDHNLEYGAGKLGFPLNQDFRGRFHSSEEQLFIAYGLTNRLALEFEAGFVRATLDRSPSDTGGGPQRLVQSGFADVEAQLRFRLKTESNQWPEVFSYLEVTAPTQKARPLIGDQQWDFRPGIGLIRGFSWGTLVSRVTVEYNHDDKLWDLGEFSVEYLKRLSPAWRINLAIEGGETGAPDEWNLISGVQWRASKGLTLRFDNGLGLSSKATDWAPQIGLMLSLLR
jgi:hypothetical protein